MRKYVVIHQVLKRIEIRSIADIKSRVNADIISKRMSVFFGG